MIGRLNFESIIMQPKISNIPDVIIIGAGLAGLAAAITLKAAGKNIQIIEASDGIGGRVRTDIIQGYQLDRGFQVLLTAYPETKRFLDYKRLNLLNFKPGAMILNQNGSTVIGDPLRDPGALLETLLSPAGTLIDKLRMLVLKIKLASSSIDQIFERNEITTLAYLSKEGFSKTMMQQFFTPFMTGIFLEDQLQTSSRMFEFVFKMFSEGNTSLPAGGMGMITKQLGENLSPFELVLNEKVIGIKDGKVLTQSGHIYQAKSVLIATDLPNIPSAFKRVNIGRHSVLNIYFTTDKAPFMKPLIALNSKPDKTFNSIAIMNAIAPNYAPEGKSLLSISVVRPYQEIFEPGLTDAILNELSFWYPEATTWQHLKTYAIDYALPNDDTVVNTRGYEAFKLKSDVFICGDHLLNGSINAALKAGRMAAEAIIAN